MRELAEAVERFTTQVGIAEHWTPGVCEADDETVAELIDAAVTLIHEARR